MPYYECVFIARQDISATQVDGLADHFTKVVQDSGGSVPKREYWGLRSLSFRIRKNRKGHYLLLNIDAPPAAVHEMERQMGINEDILRHLTVRVEQLQEGPSAIMQSRASRDDRPRREDRFGDRPPREDRFGDRPPREDRFGDRPRGDRRPVADGDGGATARPASGPVQE